MKNILSLQNKLTPDDFAPLDENYFKEESLETEEIGYWKASWIRLKSNKIAMVALVLIVIMFIFAFVGPLLSPYSYDQQVRGDEALWPCLKHPFGTDRLGRDILVRCMIGTRISMIVGLVSAVIVMIVGSIYGAISGLNTPLPAVSDAIFNATGTRFYELPITPEKIAMAVAEREKEQA